VVELGVELALVGLASRDEQVAVLVAGQQIGDGFLAPDPGFRRLPNRYLRSEPVHPRLPTSPALARSGVNHRG
jgi:hypothetical protein